MCHDVSYFPMLVTEVLQVMAIMILFVLLCSCMCVSVCVCVCTYVCVFCFCMCNMYYILCYHKNSAKKYTFNSKSVEYMQWRFSCRRYP